MKRETKIKFIDFINKYAINILIPIIATLWIGGMLIEMAGDLKKSKLFLFY